MVAAGLMPTIRQQRQQVVDSLALTRAHAQAVNAINLSLATMGTTGRPGSNVVFVPPNINRGGIFRYDHNYRRNLALARQYAESTTSRPTRPTVPVRSNPPPSIPNPGTESIRAQGSQGTTSNATNNNPFLESEDSTPSSDSDTNGANRPVCLIFPGTNTNS
jgi:hypothetical protein